MGVLFSNCYKKDGLIEYKAEHIKTLNHQDEKLDKALDENRSLRDQDYGYVNHFENQDE